jgi:CheY-like chemotaxis protein
MSRVQMKCRTCGALADVDLGDNEVQRLRGQGYLGRFCNRCRGQSNWVEQQAAGGGFRSEWATPSGPKQAAVLLIDDDPSVLAILRKALGQEDLSVDSADSAREAVRMLARDDYDLILSDIRMPEFDGKQMFAFLEQHQPQYRGRVVFLTGDTGNPETMEFLQATQCAYLSKPIDIPRLLALLRQRLSAK